MCTKPFDHRGKVRQPREKYERQETIKRKDRGEAFREIVKSKAMKNVHCNYRICQCGEMERSTKPSIRMS